MLDTLRNMGCEQSILYPSFMKLCLPFIPCWKQGKNSTGFLLSSYSSPPSPLPAITVSVTSYLLRSPTLSSLCVTGRRRGGRRQIRRQQNSCGRLPIYCIFPLSSALRIYNGPIMLKLPPYILYSIS
jgi:hypothetical protein